ncbi:MAG: cytochrome P450 [Ktedonobacterales bacterium]
MPSYTSREQFLLNPFDWYREERKSSPVSYDSTHGVWSVFRFEDVQRALSDYAVFSSAAGRGSAGAANPLGASMISSDPPRHRQLRSLVTQAFTPRTVALLEPRITAIVRELLDEVTPQAQAEGSFDLINTLAFPLPVIVIAELMGIPHQDRDLFKQWSDAIVEGPRAAGMAGRNPQQEMSAYFLRLIEERRKCHGGDSQEPEGADLIRALLNVEVEGGQQLSTIDVLGFCVLLLVAGNETTTNLIGNAILCFSEQPEDWQRLRSGPEELLGGAIEEVLRYRSPVQSMYRTTTSEVELSGQIIPAGEPVIAWIGSANRDEEQFPDPDQFDLERSPNRHLAFGHGIHFCLGAPLARLEARIALGELLRRFASLSRIQETPLEPHSSTIVYGVKHLPVTVRAD